MKKFFIAILIATFIVPNYQISNGSANILRKNVINNKNEILEKLKYEKVIFVDEPNNGLNISTC